MSLEDYKKNPSKYKFRLACRAYFFQRTRELITFTKEDAREVQFSHNDVVVVILNIINYDVRYILIDNESSTDVLLYDAFSKMGILDDRLGGWTPHLLDLSETSSPWKGSSPCL